MIVEKTNAGIRAAIEFKLGDDSLLQTFVGEPLADLTTEAIFGSPPTQSEEPYYLVKSFDGENFGSQTILLIPFIGSSGEGLGFPCNMGSCVKFVQKPSWYEDEKLVLMLREMSFHGLLSLEMNRTEVQRIFLGVPSFGAFAISECCEGVDSDSIKNGITFREQWAIASIVASWPFPYNDWKSENGVKIQGVNDGLLRHFWPFCRHGVRRETFVSVDCVLGVATGWDFDLVKMIDRLTWTCENLIAPMKIYRTDLLKTVRRKLDRVEEFLI